MDLKHLLNALPVSGLNMGLSKMVSFPAIPSFLGVQAGQSLNHVTAAGELFSDLDFSNAGDHKIEDALRRIGSAIRDQSLQLPENTFFYKTRAGWLNANPAMICVIPCSDDPKCFQAITLALEGLINQKTAQKALLRFKKAMSNLGIGFCSQELIPPGRLDAIKL